MKNVWFSITCMAITVNEHSTPSGVKMRARINEHLYLTLPSSTFYKR